MLSSLDITRILAESAGYLDGAKITGIEFYRKERAVQLYARGKKNYCVTLSFHPSRSGFYILPASKSGLETTEKYRPFARAIWSGIIDEIAQVPNDRIVEIKIDLSKNVFYLVFEIMGPNANLWLLDDKRQILLSLRKKELSPKQPYRLARLPEKYDPTKISKADLERMFSEYGGGNPYRLLEKNIYGFDFQLARSVLGEDFESAKTGFDAADIHGRLRKTVDRYRYDESPIYAYRIKSKLGFYPFKLPGYDPLDKFKTLSEAQKASLEQLQEDIVEAELHDNLIKSVESKIKKAVRLIRKLEADIDEAADYESYRRAADLLKINLPQLKRGMESITVENLFGASEPIDISLDPKLNGMENIERYARKFRKGREGLDILMRRLENTKMELNQLKETLADFEADFDGAVKQYPDLISSAAPGSISRPAVALPYKEYQTSTGLTILIGKSGDNNDRTTFEYARPYELWFHASQCPGSHVVLKYPHKNFEPSKLEIEETAAGAAFFSKARGSGKVPVSYTLKRYVRKPRKAKPGLVTIEREKTVIVEPVEPQKKSK